MTHTITFEPAGISAQVEEGEPLLLAAVRAGVYLPALCGGEGTCGKCLVRVERGQTSPLGKGPEGAEGGQGNLVRACQTTARSDLVVSVPEAARLGREALERKGTPRQAAEVAALPVGGEALVTKVKVELPPPTPQDNVSDCRRLLRGLKAEGYEVSGCGPEVLRTLPKDLREAGWTATATLTRHGAGWRLVRVQAGGTRRRNYALAVDLGTTTVCGRLIDLKARAVLSEHAEYNPQMALGEDVISRIVHSQRKGGLEELRRLAVRVIEDVGLALLDKAKVVARDLSCLTVAGNTTMAHLLCGLDPKYLREAPYVPVATELPGLSGADLGFERLGGRRLLVRLLPAVASYVGGDIVAGVLATGQARDGRLTLYIDIGTNGEIVVGNSEWLACASCSAGPAFEGGGIRHGIRATGGAIEEVRLHPHSFEPMLVTIGHTRARGICGSGLISLLAELFEVGLIDQRGRYREAATERVRRGEDGGEYVVAWAADSATGADIVLTETDIDNLVRAKGAMYAGYLTLLEGVGLSMEALERVIISGAFGSYLNLEKAVTIGLLPDLPRERFFFVGNGSLQGAARVVLSAADYDESLELARKMTNFELSESAGFMDRYVAALFLPHTEAGHFPTVAQRLGLS
jgi:uncharacterized 2Fe-2S/4Fe-4S cluster protein (DUF4445 family)